MMGASDTSEETCWLEGVAQALSSNAPEVKKVNRKETPL
jgi:hypothetical protein